MKIKTFFIYVCIDCLLGFQFDVLYFTDVFKWTFDVCVVPVAGNRGQQPATTPYEAGCNIIWRDSHANVTGTFFVSRLNSLSYEVLPPSILGSDCTPATLDMADPNVIKDCQISGSASPFAPNQPFKGRFNSAGQLLCCMHLEQYEYVLVLCYSCDTFHIKSSLYILMFPHIGWISATRRGNFSRYMQVNFGNLTKVRISYPYIQCLQVNIGSCLHTANTCFILR